MWGGGVRHTHTHTHTQTPGAAEREVVVEEGKEEEVEGLHMMVCTNVLAVCGVLVMHHGEEEVPDLMVDEGLVELIYEIVEEALQGKGSGGGGEEEEKEGETERMKIDLLVPSPGRSVVMNGMQALRLLAEKSEEAREHLGDLGACALMVDVIQTVGPLGFEREGTKDVQQEAWRFVAELAKDHEENVGRLKRCGVMGRLRDAEEASDDYQLDRVLGLARRRLGSGLGGSGRSSSADF
jgi:hypothetical protein